MNKRNEVTGRTPLLMAASEGDVPLTKLFLSRGSRVDSRDNVGETPLHVGVFSSVLPFFLLLPPFRF